MPDLALQALKFGRHNVLVVREIRLQPLQSAGLIIAINELLKFGQLRFAHLFGQLHADSHFKRFVNVSQQFSLLFLGQGGESKLLQ